MKLPPDSPLKLAIWLVLVIFLADAIGLARQAIAIIAIVFTGFCDWLIARKHRLTQSQDLSLGQRHRCIPPGFLALVANH
jgi:hypothetical protein